jgi:coenzyme PQQ precursor peptide PqqA
LAVTVLSCQLLHSPFARCPILQHNSSPFSQPEEAIMKETWTKPQVTEQEVGLEVTSYVAAEIDGV